jgi:hypothetical protein
MVLFRIIATRPHTKISWGMEIVGMDEIREYVGKNYFQTGKFLVRASTISDDELILTFATQWRSEEDRLEYSNDPVIQKKYNQMLEYWKENGFRVRVDNTEFDKKNNVVKKTESILIE